MSAPSSSRRSSVSTSEKTHPFSHGAAGAAEVTMNRDEEIALAVWLTKWFGVCGVSSCLGAPCALIEHRNEAEHAESCFITAVAPIAGIEYDEMSRKALALARQAAYCTCGRGPLEPGVQP